MSDAVSVQWSPSNGNLLAIGRLLHLRGVGQDVNIGWRYNSLNDNLPTLNVGWSETALRTDTDGSVTYVAPDGGWYRFAPKTGGGWTMPGSLNASLTKPTSTEYRIRFNDTGVTNIYQSDAGTFTLRKSIDAVVPTPNTITYTYSNSLLTKITDTQGRVINFAYNDARNLTQPSTITDTSVNRSITIAYAGRDGAMSALTDAAGTPVLFGYTLPPTDCGGNPCNSPALLTITPGPGDPPSSWSGSKLWNLSVGASSAEFAYNENRVANFDGTTAQAAGQLVTARFANEHTWTTDYASNPFST